MAACERCGATRAASASQMQLTLRSPNGTPLYLDVRIMASASPLFTTASFFCPTCFLEFMAMLSNANLYAKERLGQADTERTLD